MPSIGDYDREKSISREVTGRAIAAELVYRHAAHQRRHFSTHCNARRLALLTARYQSPACLAMFPGGTVAEK